MKIQIKYIAKLASKLFIAIHGLIVISLTIYCFTLFYEALVNNRNILQIISYCFLFAIGLFVTIIAFRFLRGYTFSFYNYLLLYSIAIIFSVVMSALPIVTSTIIDPDKLQDNKYPVSVNKMNLIFDDLYPDNIPENVIIRDVEKYYKTPEIFEKLKIRQNYKAMFLILVSTMLTILVLFSTWNFYKDYKLNRTIIFYGIVIILFLLSIVLIFQDEGISKVLALQSHNTLNGNIGFFEQFKNVKHLIPEFSLILEIFKTSPSDFILTFVFYLLLQFLILSRQLNE